MPEFLELISPDEARKLLLSSLPPQFSSELVDTAESLGRVSAAEIRAPHPLPSFLRAAVDGYALRAEDAYGASDSLPAYLTLSGEIAMGVAPAIPLAVGQCALIHTGGMVPDGANAVIMLEYTQLTQTDEVEILKSLAIGENVIGVGEDVASGDVVIFPGQRLQAAEIGGLMALGITQVWVSCKPRVGIISCGDEVIPPQNEPAPGQVRDVNAYSLSALVEETGGLPVRYGIIPDQEAALRSVAIRAIVECDMLVITAGSSASVRDLTAQVISSLGSPGILVHGVNVRPGKPTILAVCGGKPVIGLPGNPVSALVAARLFIAPVIEVLMGLKRPSASASVRARLTVNLPSQSGREDWIPVILTDEAGGGGLMAEPVFGKSNLIFTLSRADGLICVQSSQTGKSAGEMVEVFPI
jgi:molybdopterin molybdotransferase